jgi:hypothetical protein
MPETGAARESAAARMARRYALLIRIGRTHWEAVGAVISWDVVELHLHRKVRGGKR